MVRTRILAAAVGAAAGLLAFSPRIALAVPIFRLDVDSDNLAEQNLSNNGYSPTETGSGTVADPAFESWKIDGGIGTADDPDFGDPRFNQPVYTGATATPSLFRVTLKASPGSEFVDSIRRFGMPGETASYYFNDLYRDFATVTHGDASVIPTLSTTIENNTAAGGATLLPNTPYNVTFFTYDKFVDAGGNNTNNTAQNPPTFHFTDKTAGGLGAASDSYVFNRLTGFSTSAPTALDNYTWSTTMTIFTDANGKMNIDELAQTAGPSVAGSSIGSVQAILNGLQVDSSVSQSTGGNVTYGNTSAWTDGVVPDGASAVANFFNDAGGTVTLTQPRKAGSLNFAGAGSFNIAGSTLTLESFKGPRAGVSLAVRSGSHTISSNVVLNNRLFVNVNAGASLALTGMVTATGTNAYGSIVAQLDKTGGGLFATTGITIPTINVQGGTLRTTSGVTKVTSLVIGANADGPVYKVDLTGGIWAVDYAPGSTDPATLVSWLNTGRAGNAYTGFGITSSLAATNTQYAVAYAEASALNTSVVPGTAVAIDNTTFLFRVTLRGDSNLNGAVNFDDLLKLAQNYQTGSGKTWIDGDNNYDGVVNFDDLLALAQNYNHSALTGGQASQLGRNFAADFALAQSLVPEPTTLGAISLASTLLVRRRRAQ